MCAHGYNYCMIVMGISNCFLLRYKICSRGGFTPGIINLWPGRFYALGEECNIVILLNGHRIQVLSKYLASYPYISVVTMLIRKPYAVNGD